MTDDPALLPASTLLRLYRTKKLSPVEAAKAALARIARFDGAVNAFILVDEQRALADAALSEARWMRGEPCGLVDGIPSTVKDILLTAGWPTLRGSKAVDRDQPWTEDAPSVDRMRRQGAVFLGKTTTPEFGWKGVTDSALTGITRNPWNTATTPGGSSGGAAVAAALGMGTLHFGTDGGGSIRIPAGFTGIFGHKPSFGRVAAAPASPFGTVAHVGPMTRSVEDAALMLTVIAGDDVRDWFATPGASPDFRIGLDAGVRGLRIGYSPDLGYARVDPEVAACVREAVAVFAGLGAEVTEVPPPFPDPSDVFNHHWYTGAAALLSRFTPEQQALMEAGLRAVAAEGGAIPLLDYLKAVDQRVQLGATMKAFHERYDLLLTPSLAVPAFAVGKLFPDGSGDSTWQAWTPFTYPFNLTQQPACSVPCGFTARGLPIGLQLVGPMQDDALVLRAARAFEQARPWPMPEAPLSPA